jgi:hypothetical protein
MLEVSVLHAPSGRSGRRRCAFIDQVDHALEAPSAPIGIWIGSALALELRAAWSSTASIEVGAGAVHLVDEARCAARCSVSAWRQTVSDCGCTPATAPNTSDGAVEHAQRALHLDGEVDVARGVDDVDAVVRSSSQVEWRPT